MLRLLVLCVLVAGIHGHGRLVDPPSRSSMWRYGYNTPVNLMDDALQCGGAAKKCGICGDPFAGPRENEAGGKYAKGIITRHYLRGKMVKVDVEIVKNHGGWFEFRICPNNNVNKPATEACLNQHLLELADGTGTRYTIDSHIGHFHIKVKLPPDLTCLQCVFQWKYHATVYPASAGGKGLPEEFFGCADVAVLGDGQGSTPSPMVHHTFPHRSTQRPGQGIHCHAIGEWAGNFQKDVWCRSNCYAGKCPTDKCQCT